MKQPDTTTTSGKIAVMQAFERFGRVQVLLQAEWAIATCPSFDWGYKWRIHPDDLTTMEQEADPYWQLKQWFAEDGVIEYQLMFSKWGQTTDPGWDLPPNQYRRSQKPQPQPWTQEDVPPVCWIRFKAHPFGWHIVKQIEVYGISFGGNSKNWEQLSNECEYSTDLKTWRDCTK